MPTKPAPPTAKLISFTTQTGEQVIGSYFNGLFYSATSNDCWSPQHVTAWHHVRVVPDIGGSLAAAPTNPTDPAARPLQPGEYVRYRSPGTPTVAGRNRPGRIVHLNDHPPTTEPGQPGAATALVHWLDEDGEYSVPADRLTRATWDPWEPHPIEDEDGTVLPTELQHGGQLWMAVLDGLRSGFLTSVTGRAITDADVEETVVWVMIRLAPLLWPLLPSNDASPSAVIAQHGGVFQQRREALSDLEHLIALAIAYIADHPAGQEPGWQAAAIEQARANLRALGVTDPELDTAGIRPPVPVGEPGDGD